jgi:trimethylamine--corrinoid protein Co-methyltransferase
MNPANVQIDRLSADQCDVIHNASLQILSRTGVRLHHKEAIEMLDKAGAQVSDGNLVRIPAALVEKALSTAPKQIPMFDRSGQPAMLWLDGKIITAPTVSTSLTTARTKDAALFCRM